MESLKHRIKSWFGGFTVRIKDGPLKGMKWAALSGSNFVRGTYEEYKTKALLAHLREGQTVIDVGAHVGYFAAIASVVVGPTGRVFAFEPRPLNHRYLIRHISSNRLENITPFRVGVAAKRGRRRFEVNTGTGTGHLSPEGALEIDTVSIDEEVAAGRLPAPDLIKIDVEGGEIEVLQGAEVVIHDHRPKMLVATHGADTHAFVVDFLARHDYAYEILDPGGAAGDVEIMAVPRMGRPGRAAPGLRA